jgi:uncharacterized protein DUF4136
MKTPKGENNLKVPKTLAVPLFLAMLSAGVLADHVTVDYDHAMSFGNLKTYSWSKVQPSNSIRDGRLKDAINLELAAKGWTEAPSGGDVALVAVERTSGWRWEGFGTPTAASGEVGTLVVSMFDSKSKHLIWRGKVSSDLSTNPDNNTKKLCKDVQKMFKNFPPRAS